MKRTYNLLLVSALSCTIALGQLFQARLVTSAYGWQRNDTVGQTNTHLYGYQTVQVSLADQRYSFNANIQGFNDFAGPVKNDPLLRLQNLSLKARNLFDMADVQAGRFFLVAGAGIGLMDGAQATVRLPWYPVKLVAYGGALAPAGRKFEIIDDVLDNKMWGAQALVQPIHGAQFSLSYANKRMSQSTYRAIRADDLLTGTKTVELKPEPRNEQLLSFDASGELPEWGDGYLRYDHDLESMEMSRLNAFARVRVMEGLALTGEYLQREPRVAFNSIFSVFAYSTLKEAEGGVEYEVLKNWFLVAKYGSVSYGDGSTDRITIAANGRFVGASLSRNTTYNGDISAASLNASYPLFDNLVTPTLLVGFSQYKLDAAAPLENALSLAAGAVVRPLPTLNIDAQVQWINNRIYANDVRLFVRLSYQLSRRLDLF
ncbi:MAG: hypothetical protein MUE68_04680 [Bacteroidetes bacterium]|nr:hypothetical protein [Bacteroidota bacterium]